MRNDEKSNIEKMPKCEQIMYFRMKKKIKKKTHSLLVIGNDDMNRIRDRV